MAIKCLITIDVGCVRHVTTYTLMKINHQGENKM